MYKISRIFYLKSFEILCSEKLQNFLFAKYQNFLFKKLNNFLYKRLQNPFIAEISKFFIWKLEIFEELFTYTVSKYFFMFFQRVQVYWIPKCISDK